MTASKARGGGQPPPRIPEGETDMARKITENPAGGPAQEREPAVDPVLSQMAAAQKLPPNPQPLYYQRGIPGRDGTGEWRVLPKGAVMMPNGDYAKPGDTFNQRDEGFNDAQMRHMVGQFIEPNKFREVQPHMVPKPVKLPDPVKVTKPGPGEIVKKAEASEPRGPNSASC